MAENNFDKITSQADNAVQKSKKVAKDYLTTITFIVLILGTIALSLFTMGVNSPDSVSFWVNVCYVLVINIVSFCVMTPQGADAEKKMLKGYFENRTLWSQKTGIVNNGKSSEFNEYCRQYTNKIRKEKRESYILSASISLDDFYKYFDKMKLKDLKEYYKKCKKERYNEDVTDLPIPLSFMQYRLLVKAKKPIHIRPIIATKILNNSSNANEYQIGQQRMSYTSKAISLKMVSVVAYSLAFASVALVPTGADGWSAIATILFRLVTLTTSAVYGYATGRNATKRDNSDTLDRITFLCGFLEKQQHTIEEKTKESA